MPFNGQGHPRANPSKFVLECGNKVQHTFSHSCIVVHSRLDYVYISRRKRIIPSTPVTSVPAAEQSEGVENRNQTESGMAREETKIQSGSEQDMAKRMS